MAHSTGLFSLLAGILVAALPPVSLGAATYYVAPPPAGGDSNSGTLGSPWATLQHAAGVIQPGDTVLLRAGSFAGAHFTTSGTVALPITVKAFPGETVEIDDDNPHTPDGINLEGASHFVVEGLHINGRTRAGIRAVLCENVVLRGNRLDGNGRWGIFTGFCDDLLIESNHTSNSGDEHGIYVSNSGDRPTIRGNRIWDNRANGIHMNGDASQGGDGIISEAVVENNTIYGNGLGGGSGINMDGVQSSIIRNNLLFDNHASGISLYRIDGGAASTGNHVYNNTVIVADDGRWALNIKNSSTDNRVRNNVFYNYHSFRGSVSVTADSLAGFSSDHNVVMDRFTVDDGDTVLSLAEWRAQTGHDQDSLRSSPAALFIDPGGDFHLREGSPALDNGETLTQVLTDLEGTPRPLGPAFDIGAYEGLGVIFVDGVESGDTRRWTLTIP